MPKWWEKAVDAVTDFGEDLLEDGVDLVQNGSCYQTVSKLKESGSECYQLATETRDLCDDTASRGNAMVSFGSEILETLQGFSTTMDVETLETIKDLMDGDRLRESMALAKDMDDIALECVEKSVRMVSIMEETMEDVPEPLQKMATKLAGQDDAVSREEQERTRGVLSSLDQDMEDVTSCIDALQHLNISTALSVGTRAFENLSAKATLSQSMFTTMRGFSEEVAGYTEAINDGDVGDMFKLATKLKDVWHCLTLSGLMRELAVATGKLIRVIIDLFKAMSDRLSTLWSALAFAKDCMMDCVEHVLQAKDLILNAQEKGNELIERSRSISNQLDDIDDFNMDSIMAIQQLSQGDDIKQAIDIAGTMDDLVIECTSKVLCMVERVTEGYQNLPDIITADVDAEEEGKKDDDPEPEDIEDNVAKLERSREAIDNSDIITAAGASVQGFRGVMNDADICQKMLALVQGFTGDCNDVLDSFLGVWDLEAAMDKISEMCRIVRLGEMIKNFANQIKRLLEAIVALMKSAFQKFSIENLADIDLGEALDAVKDSIGDIKKKLKFWKK